jgi:hypothetical protein
MRRALFAISAAAGLLVACEDDDGFHRPVSPELDAAEDAAPLVDGEVTDAGSEAGGAPRRVDRAGRPFVSRLLVGGSNRDRWNQQDTYGAQLGFIDGDFGVLLDRVDTLGGDPSDWRPGGTPAVHPLRDVLKQDVLVVDTSKPCTVDTQSYFDVEAYVTGLRGAPNTTCGGRTPNDDAFDATLSLLHKKSLARLVSDGVNAPTKPASPTWPYLREPN